MQRPKKNINKNQVHHKSNSALGFGVSIIAFRLLNQYFFYLCAKILFPAVHVYVAIDLIEIHDN